MLIQSTFLKPNVCDICGYVASIKAHLKDHMKVKHDTDGNDSICDMCDYKTINNSKLSEHKRIPYEKVVHYFDQCAFTSK